MSLRDDFEKLFPVPEGVKWDGDDYIYTRSKAQTMDGVTLGRYNDCWQGFQAGHAAGLEAAAKYLDTLNVDEFYQPHRLANNIRAMKGEVK